MFSEHILVRILFLLLFLSLVGGILGVIVWRRSVMLGISLTMRHIVIVAFGLLAVFVGGMFLTHTNWYPAEFFGTILMAVVYSLWVLIPVLVIVEIVHIRYKLPVLWIVVLSVLWLGMGLYQGMNTKIIPLTIKHSKVKENRTIVFISDLHVNTIRHRGYIQSLVNRIKQIDPDMVLIGGDLFDSAKADYVDAFLPFNQITVPIVVTLGNHDHMGDANVVDRLFQATNMILLRNESILIDGIQIVGIDDTSFRGSKTLTGVLEDARVADTGQFTLLLSHRPQHLSKLATYPIDLQLAGHTHRGQFIPLSWIVGWFNDYAYGLYHDGAKTAYVSQGVGIRGVPIRTGTHSEVVVISLEK